MALAVQALGVLLVALGAYLTVARATDIKGAVEFPGVAINVPASLLVLFAGVLVFLFPLSPWWSPEDASDMPPEVPRSESPTDTGSATPRGPFDGDAVQLSPVLRAVDVKAVTASSHDGNVPQNTLDGDLDTRWSAAGDGQWIAYEFRKVTRVAAIEIAWFRGDERAASFEVQTSSDGRDWAQIFEGFSSGSTLNLERYSLDPTDATHIRVVGHGNTSRDKAPWNSITEVVILGIANE